MAKDRFRSRPLPPFGLLLLALASIGALIGVAGGAQTMAPPAVTYIRHVAGFTFSGLPVVDTARCRLPVARACWRGFNLEYNFLILSFLPVVMPTTVAATGLIGVWVKRHSLPASLRGRGHPLPPVYGLGAVLLRRPCLFQCAVDAAGPVRRAWRRRRPSGACGQWACPTATGSGRSNGRR